MGVSSGEGLLGGSFILCFLCLLHTLRHLPPYPHNGLFLWKNAKKTKKTKKKKKMKKTLLCSRMLGSVAVPAPAPTHLAYFNFFNFFNFFTIFNAFALARPLYH